MPIRAARWPALAGTGVVTSTWRIVVRLPSSCTAQRVGTPQTRFQGTRASPYVRGRDRPSRRLCGLLRARQGHRGCRPLQRVVVVPSSRLDRSPPMKRLCLSEIRLRYVVEGRPLDAATEALLGADTRSGARAILAAVARRRFDNRSEGQRLRKLLRYE